MEKVRFARESVLYGKYPFADCDYEKGVRHPVGMESFVIERPHSSLPLVIPAQLAAVWSTDLIAVLDNQMMMDGDYLLVTAPKAGTHWLWEVMSMLTKGKAAYLPEAKHSTWCEFKPFPDIITGLVETPRVLNTHQTLSQLPPNFRQRSTKTVVCMRNPKDVLVSQYHHYKNFTPKDENNNFMLSFDDMFDFLLHSKYAPFGRTLDHYADTWDNHRGDPNVLIILYEDMKEKTLETLKLIADHMEVEYTEKLIADVCSATNIAAMKRGKYTSESIYRARYGQKSSLYRNGEIGDWKNHFSTKQNEEFNKIYEEWNRERAVPFRFEPSL